MMARNVLTDNFSEPLNDVMSAEVDINAGDGNLTIDRLSGGEQLLASGTLQYLQNQGLPTHTLALSNGQASLTLMRNRGRQPWFRLPWAACNGATEWRIHLNPAVSSDIAAHSDGGNIRLDLTGMAVIRVSADTGGGNVEVVLPDNAAELNVTAKTGAGNVTVEIGSDIRGSNMVSAKSGAGNVSVCVPSGVAARIHITTGLGKATVHPRFGTVDHNTYQSSDFDGAANKIEIVLGSGAGNVSVNSE